MVAAVEVVVFRLSSAYAGELDRVVSAAVVVVAAVAVGVAAASVSVVVLAVRRKTVKRTAQQDA